MIVDVHCHLDFDDFNKDLDEVIERARKAGVVKIITSGTSKKSNEEILKIRDKYDIVEVSMGFYPTEVNLKNIDDEISFVREHKKDIFAIGECGLDYKEATNKEEQQRCFKKIIKLSEEINKPLIIHSRKAEADVLDLLEKSSNKKIILHCFSANMKLVQRAIDLGYFFSIPTVITRLEHFKEVVKRVPLNKILTETDAPFLSSVKGGRNESAFIVETIKEIARIKDLDKKEVESIVFMNYQQVFS